MILFPLLLALAQTPPATPPVNWAAALREDARALHDGIAANHPGPVNPLDPDFARRNDAGLALAPLIAALEADRAAVVQAPRIVLDLRGNRGGSSEWGLQIARILWGRQRVDAIQDPSYVEWRASAANIATIADAEKQYDRPETSAEIRQYFAMLLKSVREAQASGHALWREPSDAVPPPAVAASGPAPVPPARVYFVTDTGCASACLDAADLWKALDAVQLGQETSADTLYMDVRNPVLPSGLAGTAIPMKVYRDRPRGANVPLRPVHPYPGDMRDTAALEAWIAQLRD